MGLAIYLDEIDQAVDAGLSFAAILAALTIPDICGALCHTGGRASEKRYVDWYNDNARHICRFFTGQDCYRLRCGIVHQGRALHPRLPFDRVAFTSVGGNHCNLIVVGKSRYLNLGVDQFCKGLTTSARTWIDAHQNEDIVKRNLELMLQERVALPHPIVHIGRMIY